MLTLTCLIVGDGSVFPVDIEKEKQVGHLKDKIKEKIQKLTDCDSRELTLYSAKKNGNINGEWITDEDKIEEHFETMDFANNMIMVPSVPLNEYFPSKLSTFYKKEDGSYHQKIHVLVILPNVVGKNEQLGKKRKREDILNPFNITYQPAASFQDFPQLFKGLALVSSFKDIREKGLYYADKTRLLMDLVEELHVFLSRPRRFGKSLVISVLQHLFLGHKDLFVGLYAYDKWKWEENKCPVITLDFSSVSVGSFKEDLLELIKKSGRSWNIELTIKESTSPGIALSELLTKLQRTFKRKVVILIDEYDMPITKCMNESDEVKERLLRKNQNILMDIFLVIKSEREIIHFSLVTGSSRLARTSIFSGDNARKDISFYNKYDALCGFTLDDIKPYLKDENELLTEEILTKWYDGYEFGGESKIFNPFSIVNAFSNRKPGYYWAESGITSSIKKFCEDSKIAEFVKDIIPEGVTKKVDVNRGISVEQMLNKQIPVQDVMVQAGFLAVSKKGEGNFEAKIANDEVRHGVLPFLASLCLPELKDAGWTLTASNAIQTGNMEKLYKLVYNRLCGMAYSYAGNNMQQKEEFYKFMIYASLHELSGVVCKMEKAVSCGRMDLLIEAKEENIKIIIELKILKECKQSLTNEDIINKGANLANDALEQARRYSAGEQANIIAGWVINGKNRTLLNVDAYGKTCHCFEILDEKLKEKITKYLSRKEEK